MAGFSDALLDAESEADLLARTARVLVESGLFTAACVAHADADGNLKLGDGAGPAHATLESLQLRLDDEPQSPPALAWSTSRSCLESDLGRAGWLADAGNGGQAALGSMLAVPVRSDGDVTAVLCVGAATSDAFGEAELDLCRRVGRLLERWLDHHGLLPHLQHQALHDPLTDLPNRRMLEEHLTRALPRARRHGSVVAVGVMDIDDFKPINDTCGHEAGDRLLQQVGARLRSELREHDLLVRLGGDEFALVIEDLLPGQAAAQLSRALDRLQNAIAPPFELGHGQHARIAMSLGVALFPFDGEERDQLLRQADVAMYRAKSGKLTRTQYWQLASASQDLPEPDVSLDPYGPQAADLLEGARAHFAAVSTSLSGALLGELRADESVGAGLEGMDDGALEAHVAGISRHLEQLFRPDLDREALKRGAEEMGRAYALAGLGAQAVVQSHGLCRALLDGRLAASFLTTRERYRLMQVAEARLQDETQLELAAHSATVACYYKVGGAPMQPRHAPWTDVRQAELESLAQLPGMRAAALHRPDADGHLTVEARAGEAGAELAALACTPEHVQRTDAAHAEAAGTVARAWASGTIQLGSKDTDGPRTRPWHEALETLGILSVMAVPIHGTHDRPAAILVLYGSTPGQFDAPWVQTFALGVQQRWDDLWRRSRDPARPALPRARAEVYRSRLFDGGLTMHVQPVLDLETGDVAGTEALARLRMPDGEVLSPGVFLPLLGEVELARLFRLTLEQSLAALSRWDASAGGSGDAITIPEIAVNLPPSTLLEPACGRWVGDALERYGILPQRLSLELIETEEIGQQARSEAIQALVGLGVRLSIDDLGSGFSSLQRLAELPCDTLKIDQGLVGRMQEAPLQTLSLVRSLVRLGNDLGRRVVIEGVGDAGMIEAAAVLGGRLAQGFGIARPMATEALPAWHAGFRSPVDARRIRTAMGALAWHWRAHNGRQLSHPPSLTACPLSGYFREAGLEASEGARWHAQIHSDVDADGAGERLLTWLLAQVESRPQPA
ncbi:MAG: EAL domain-containing protein [Deinococcales bacterium]